MSNNLTNTPLVSVIVNCLNGERYLKKSLDSIYKQTYENFEIIFWNNGSTDRSKLIASEYEYKIRLYSTEETVPLGMARNRALRKAKGSYIAFLDVDDWWAPRKLEKQLNRFNNKDVGLLYCDSTIIENNLKYNQIVGNINKIKDKISKLTTNLDERINRRDGFLVEIHKKFSLPFSCFIFILLGIPLGIISKNGGMAVSVSISLLFFILYWGFFTIGEFLAEEGTLDPALSMWLGNLIVGALSMLLFYLTSKENITLNLKFLSRLLIKKTS